jgi:repressor of nif and glnA expression
MSTKADRTKVAILKALHEIGGAAGASRIMEQLSAEGLNLQARTVRFYLAQLDREGMTRLVSRRRGREITDRGREELAHANVAEKVGFIAAKVDTLGYQMSFRHVETGGSIIANVALIDARAASASMREMDKVFARRLGMGRRLAVAGAGERLGNLTVPDGMLGIGTVCSVTVNGILLHHGIPVTSRFGGLLEMRGGRPSRFVELIDYAGTTLDPLETFIRAGMTDVRGCARSGDGIIGASFREVPSVAIDDVKRICRDMERLGLGGVMDIGRPNLPLLDIPVSEGRAGMIVIGGLNPMAAVYETGIRVSMLSLAGLAEFSLFVNINEVVSRYV